METIVTIQGFIDEIIKWPLLVMLLGTGVFLTFRLGFIQFRRMGHGIRVAMGKYDDPEDTGDVTHFQALTTALSATVGIGNIAGVAIAIHWGGPGAIFWMWVTALLGMATKYTEVTLALRYRHIEKGAGRMVGTVSGGPMYYIERGLGIKFKPLAIFVASGVVITALLTGNAIQANTVADLMQAEFGAATWVTGLITAGVVALVILGGISRIGKVTGILAPSMAAIYVIGGLIILAMNYQAVLPSLGMIFTEAFNPTAGVAGTGVGILLQTLLWGVRRGLFSNEAGQGSAPIAHSAAKTEEPVSEGVVALLEPFIDTIVICTLTALVVLTTGVWRETTDTHLTLTEGDLSYVVETEQGWQPAEDLPAAIEVREGQQMGGVHFAWHEVPVTELYTDEDQSMPFTGEIRPGSQVAVAINGQSYEALYGPAVENGAPLTAFAFSRGLGRFGNLIVVISVLLFGISTAISWSYYGDRSAMYIFGRPAILPYKLLFVAMHFVGAVVSLNVIWNLGDTALALLTIPNVLALLLLSGIAKKLTDDYFSAFGSDITRNDYLRITRERQQTRNKQKE